MFKHVVEVDGVEGIVRTVDVIVGNLPVGFDDKSSWVTGSSSGSVVRAGVATVCVDVADVSILFITVSYGIVVIGWATLPR